MKFRHVFYQAKNIFTRKRNSANRLVFVHVPKCGGRSIEAAIKNGLGVNPYKRDYVRIDSKSVAKMNSLFHQTDYTFGDTNDYDILDFSEKYLVYNLCRNKCRFISGHFPFSKIAYDGFNETFQFVTILRDPVKKWLSNYYFRKYRESDHWLISDDIYAYAKSEKGKYHGYDYAKYYGGIRKENDYTTREAIENAKENLHLFDIVGILENLYHFSNKFEQKFGAVLQIGNENQSVNPDKEKIDPEVLTLVEEICRPDIEIYNYAIQNFIQV